MTKLYNKSIIFFAFWYTLLFYGYNLHTSVINRTLVGLQFGLRQFKSLWYKTHAAYKLSYLFHHYNKKPLKKVVLAELVGF